MSLTVTSLAFGVLKNDFKKSGTSSSRQESSGFMKEGICNVGLGEVAPPFPERSFHYLRFIVPLLSVSNTTRLL